MQPHKNVGSSYPSWSVEHLTRPGVIKLLWVCAGIEFGVWLNLCLLQTPLRVLKTLLAPSVVAVTSCILYQVKYLALLFITGDQWLGAVILLALFSSPVFFHGCFEFGFVQGNVFWWQALSGWQSNTNELLLNNQRTYLFINVSISDLTSVSISFRVWLIW